MHKKQRFVRAHSPTRSMPQAYREQVSIFADRAAAGRELASVLHFARGTPSIIVGIPRGGVVVAAEVARILGLALAAVIVRKLGAPQREEYAIGAIADGVRIIDDDAVLRGSVTPAQLAELEAREHTELVRRQQLFTSSAPPVAGREVIVVDDGIATGATALAACRALREQGAARIVLAVPVAPAEWRPDRSAIDEYVCPHRMRRFWAVGQFYRDFTQTSDEEVELLLSREG